MGPSGIGKGTQAVILKEKHGYNHFVMSDHLKKIEACKKIIDAGRLVPDELTIDTALHALPDKLPAFITFDGIPRSLGQAQWLVDHLSASECRVCVIDMRVDIDIAIKRIVNRVIEAEKSTDPNRPVREDDKNPDAVRRKLNKYYEEYGTVVANYLRKRMVACGAYYEIDATPDISDVSRIISGIIRKEHSIMRFHNEESRQFSAQTVPVMG